MNAPIYAAHWRISPSWRIALVPIRWKENNPCSRCPVTARSMAGLYSGTFKVASLQFCPVHTPEKGDIPRFDVEGYPGDEVQ